jgi:hypothetical protein
MVKSGAVRRLGIGERAIDIKNECFKHLPS